MVDCYDLLDVTDDGGLDVIDALHLLRYVFSRGPGLPAPFPTCGSDPTAEAPSLACVEPSCR